MTVEYLRRNLNIARVIGASAGAKTATSRLTNMKKPPKWLVKQLEGIESRLAGLSAELAAWRDMADDAPQYGITPSPPSGEVVPLTTDWVAVGRILEAHHALRGQFIPGTSNWGAAIWKAAHGIKEGS